MSLTEFFASFQTCAVRQRHFVHTLTGKSEPIYGDVPTDKVLLRVTTTCASPDGIGDVTNIHYYSYPKKLSKAWYDATQSCLFKQNPKTIRARNVSCVFQAERVVWDAETHSWESV